MRKSHLVQIYVFVRKTLLPAFALVILTLTATVPASARGTAIGPNFLIAPPDSTPYGKTYGEWSAKHWQWTYSLRPAHHPLLDTAMCSAGQSGKVWFLGGTYATTVDPNGVVVGEADRICTVPQDTALFFPVIDAECSTLEGNGATEQELRTCATFLQDHAHGLRVTIDGIRIKNLSTYRTQSPLFTFGPLPKNNLLGAPKGSTSPAVSDGVFLMLEPLSKGTHTIHLHSAASFSTEKGDPFDFEFRQDITYHLNIVDGSNAN